MQREPADEVPFRTFAVPRGVALRQDGENFRSVSSSRRSLVQTTKVTPFNRKIRPSQRRVQLQLDEAHAGNLSKRSHFRASQKPVRA
jgi:hypothetical protein